MDPWWTEQGAGIAGAIVGGVGGSLLGGIGGGVCGPLAAAGRGRAFVMAFFWTAIVISAALVVTGAVAMIFLDQPTHVWLVLTAPGALFGALSGGLMPGIKKRYADAEQRKLAAEELRRG
ncbi:MAG: hypothetical protein RIB60_01045 [Phycisphaerales bacterium]